MPPERLQKVMARAGIASRRACEELITAGRVEVNGKVVTELGTKVDAQRDEITVDGAPLVFDLHPARSYLMLYKPAGYLSVFDDERGRPGLEKLAPSAERLFTVGRLDLDSEGLLLLTNDGELAQVLSHPSHQHAKVYLALVDHRPGTDDLARLQRGVQVDGQKTAPSTWRVMEEAPKVQPAAEGVLTQGVWLKVVLREGRKRQIRRMAAVVGLDVRRLIRIQLGPLVLDRKLKPGESRRLTRDEIQRLHLSVRHAEERSARGARFAAQRGSSAPRRPAPTLRRSTGTAPPSAALRRRSEPVSRGPASSPARPRSDDAPRGPAPRPSSAPRSRPPERDSSASSPARQRGGEASRSSAPRSRPLERDSGPSSPGRQRRGEAPHDASPRPRPEAPANRRPGPSGPARPRSGVASRDPATRPRSEGQATDRRPGPSGPERPRGPMPRPAGLPPAPGGPLRGRSGGERSDKSPRPPSPRSQARRPRPVVGSRPAGSPKRKR